MLSLDAHNLHHAYILEGKRESVITKLYDFFQKELGIRTEGNPNFWQKEYGNFGIDDSRELQEIASRKAASESLRVFVIVLNSITLQAQNALLKMFEEPGERTHFFLIIPSLTRILPTLRSRVLVSSMDSVSENTLPSRFIAVPKPQRLKIVKELLAEIEKEEKTKQDGIEFLQDILFLLYQKKEASLWTEKDKKALEELQQAINYASDQSSSLKLLLEHAALLI